MNQLELLALCELIRKSNYVPPTFEQWKKLVAQNIEAKR